MAEVKLDPVRYELFYNKLRKILDEGKEVIRYLSGSVITREAGEVLQAFYLPSGEAVEMAANILMHFMNVTRVIRYMNENRYDAEDIGIYDGDQFVNNDAFIGGMHIPDISVAAPFLYKGELLGWIAGISHTTEMGAIDPGGMSPRSTEAWHEGLRLPVVKLVEKGTMRRDLWEMLIRGSREPRGLEMDMRARISGNERVRQRLTELVDEFGADFFKAAAKQMVVDGEEFIRARVKDIKPGIYSSRVYCDAVGMEERLAVIQVDLEVTPGGELIVHTPVISPQCPGFNNAYLPATEATTMYALLTGLVYDGRWNSGIANVVKLDIPLGSRLNADFSRAVGYATVGIGLSYWNAFTEALCRALYVSGKEEEAQAGTYVVNTPVIAGVDRMGKPFAGMSMQPTAVSGGGAAIGRDGYLNYAVFSPNLYAPDMEGEETIMPILLLTSRLIADSGGPGKWRGGLQGESTSMIHKANFSIVLTFGSGGKAPVHQGLFGAYPSGAAALQKLQNTDFYEKAKQGKELPYKLPEEKITDYIQGEFAVLPVNMPALPARPGDILVATGSGGGGGLGDPIERDPSLIVKDLRSGWATPEWAQKIYCAAIDADTLEIDHKKTDKLREEKRRERLKKGVTAKEYIKEMVDRRKKRELPKPALDFLDETTAFSKAFQNQLETEEKLMEARLEPLKKVKIKNLLFKLTLYVNIVEDDKGRKVAVCSNCGYAYCEANDNFKLYSLVYDRDPAEIHPPYISRPKEWCIYREFYCPGCGVQTEVEATPPGTPIVSNYELTS